MKYLRTMLWGAVFVMPIGIMSCKKNHCYYCYYYVCAFFATKTGDTIYVHKIFSSSEYHDSISKYVNSGYNINLLPCGYNADPGTGIEVCDTNSVYNGQPVRDSCAIII